MVSNRYLFGSSQKKKKKKKRRAVEKEDKSRLQFDPQTCTHQEMCRLQYGEVKMNTKKHSAHVNKCGRNMTV